MSFEKPFQFYNVTDESAAGEKHRASPADAEPERQILIPLIL